MKKLFVLLVGILLVLVLYYFSNKQQNLNTHSSPMPTITLNNHIYQVEIADTDEKRAQGLSNRSILEADRGLLFLFPAKDRYAFWMKDMHFPLDILWIDDDTIIDISENVPIPLTATYLPRYQPKAPVNRVLEINAGEAKKYGILPGQKVIMSGI